MRDPGFMAVAMARLLCEVAAVQCKSIKPVPQLEPCTKRPMKTCAVRADEIAAIEPSLKLT